MEMFKNVWMWGMRVRILEVSSVCNQVKGKRSKGLFVSLFSFRSACVQWSAFIMHVMEGEEITQAWTGEKPSFPFSFPHLVTVAISDGPIASKLFFPNLKDSTVP